MKSLGQFLGFSLFLAAIIGGMRGRAAPAGGPLKVHPSNPRYFADASGRAILLVGSHTWNSLQDMGETDPPPAFDFDAYLDFLTQRHHNFIRLWRWELVNWDTGANGEKSPRRVVAMPHPWLRTGPGEALDGRPKFNLDEFNPDYFGRLRSRVTAARDRGIYVSIMLFEGWGLRFTPDGLKGHPFHPTNNVQGPQDGLKANLKGIELFTLASPRITARQEAYVRRVVDTVNDLDNVLYEIANESDFSTTDWQYHWIRFIKTYESSKPRQHPVGMTSIGYGVDDLERLLASPADWISPNPDRFNYKDDPPASAGAKVILLDTDHLWGIGGSVAWVWKSVLRGLNPLFMDPYDRRILEGPADAQWETVRRALGVARRLTDRIKLETLKPQNELASTRYCLANPGSEYVIYLPTGDTLTVDLSGTSGELVGEWIDPRSGDVTPAGRAQSGARRSFSAPRAGDWVLHLGLVQK